MISHIDVEYPALPHFRQEHATWTWTGRKWKPVIVTLVIPEMFSTIDEQAALDAVPSGTTFEITVVHSKTWGTGAIMTQPGKPCHTPASVSGLSRSRNPHEQSCSLGHSMNTLHRQWTETLTIPMPDGDVDVEILRADMTLDLETMVMYDYEPTTGGKKRRFMVPPRRADQLDMNAPDTSMDAYVPVDPAVREDLARKMLVYLFQEALGPEGEKQKEPFGFDPASFKFGMHLTIRSPNRHTGVMEDSDAMWCTAFPVNFADLLLVTRASTIFPSI